MRNVRIYSRHAQSFKKEAAVYIGRVYKCTVAKRQLKTPCRMSLSSTLFIELTIFENAEGSKEVLMSERRKAVINKDISHCPLHEFYSVGI